jgi:hypothetical protein
MYRLCVYVYKPLPPGVYAIAVDKYINKPSLWPTQPSVPWVLSHFRG